MPTRPRRRPPFPVTRPLSLIRVTPDGVQDGVPDPVPPLAPELAVARLDAVLAGGVRTPAVAPVPMPMPMPMPVVPHGEPAHQTGPKVGVLEAFPDFTADGRTLYRYMSERGNPYLFNLPAFGCDDVVEGHLAAIIDHVEARDAERAARAAHAADELAARWADRDG